MPVFTFILRWEFGAGSRKFIRLLNFHGNWRFSSIIEMSAASVKVDSSMSISDIANLIEENPFCETLEFSGFTSPSEVNKFLVNSSFKARVFDASKIIVMLFRVKRKKEVENLNSEGINREFNGNRPFVIGVYIEEDRKLIVAWKDRSGCFRSETENHISDEFFNFLIEFLKECAKKDIDRVGQHAPVSSKKIKLSEIIDETGHNLLIAAVIAGNLDAATSLLAYVDVNGKCAGPFETPIQAAYHRQNGQMCVALIKGNSLLPDDCDFVELEKLCPELRQLLVDMDELHRLVSVAVTDDDKNWLEDVKKLEDCERLSADLRAFCRLAFKYGQSMTYCFNRANQSLLHHALTAGRFPVAKFLQNILEMECGPHETSHRVLFGQERSENVAKCEKLDNHDVSVLLEKSRLKRDGRNDKLKARQAETLRKVYEYLFSIVEMRVILMIVAAYGNIVIAYDTTRDDVSGIDIANDRYTLGLAALGSGQAIVGALSLFSEAVMQAICDSTFNFDKDSDERAMQVVGTLFHELTHLALYLVFYNGAKPFSKSDSGNFNRVLRVTKRKVKKYSNDKKSPLYRIIGTVFKSYEEPQQAAELAVRPAQVYAEFSRRTDMIERFREEFPELFNFFDQLVTTIMGNALPCIVKMRESTSTFTYDDLTKEYKLAIGNCKVRFQGDVVPVYKVFRDDEQVRRSLLVSEMQALLDGTLLCIGESIPVPADVTRRFRLKNEPKSQPKTLEDIVDYADTSKVLILQDANGEGKTKALQRAAFDAKKRNEGWWVIYVNGTSLTSERPPQTETAIDFLVRILKFGGNTLEARALKKFYDCDDLVIFWDNIDPAVIERVFMIIRNDTRNQQWLSMKKSQKVYEAISSDCVMEFVELGRDEMKKLDAIEERRINAALKDKMKKPEGTAR